MAWLKKNQKMIIAVVLILIIFSFAKFIESEREHKLDNYNITKAIYLNKENINRANFVNCFFIKNKRKVFIKVVSNETLKYGDTILIKYSVQDNSIAEMVDPNYMDKYKK